MDERSYFLTLPSLVVLAALVLHSLRALPRWRALAFWVSVTAYGLARGIGVRIVTGKGLGAQVPYVIHRPLLTVQGVSIQEVVGWAIVSYLAWWLGDRFVRGATRDEGSRVFPQITWACLSLGAIGLAIERAAVAAGWWHWTVPFSGGPFLEVPLIGIVDWAFVGLDFLLPFVVLSASAFRRSPARFLTLAVFPVHFASHALTERVADWFPVPVFHLVHWSFTGILLWLALRSSAEDAAFGPLRIAAGPVPGRTTRPAMRFAELLPLVALAAVLVDVAFVETARLWKPELLSTLVPTVALTVASFSRTAGIVAGIGAAVLSPFAPPLLPAAAPSAVAWLLGAGRRIQRLAALPILSALAGVALTLHASAARREGALRAALDAALEARDAGDQGRAVALLGAVCGEPPESHAACAILGEIQYRTGRLDEARAAFERAVRLKPDFLKGHRYLAVIALARAEVGAARAAADRGLAIAPDDLELGYLQRRAAGLPAEVVWRRASDSGPKAMLVVAALAFEVGDTEGAAEGLDRGLALWPGEPSLYDSRIRIALSRNDRETARRIAEAWQAHLPGDAGAAEAVRRLVLP